MNAKVFNCIAPLIVAVLVVALLMAASNASRETIKDDVTVTPGHAPTAEESLAMSVAASRILLHIADARGAIHDNKVNLAKEEMDKARILVDIIKQARPTTKIKYHIEVAKKHLEYEDIDEVVQDLVPIDSELVNIEDFLPVKKAREHLSNASQKLKEGNKQAAVEQLNIVEDMLI